MRRSCSVESGGVIMQALSTARAGERYIIKFPSSSRFLWGKSNRCDPAERWLDDHRKWWMQSRDRLWGRGQNSGLDYKSCGRPIKNVCRSFYYDPVSEKIDDNSESSIFLVITHPGLKSPASSKLKQSKHIFCCFFQIFLCLSHHIF